MPLAHIAILDDEPDITALLGTYLSSHGYRVSELHRGAALMTLLKEDAPALVLLDLLSDPGDLDEAPYSLNSYMNTSSDRVAFVSQAVGNVVAHEVGHMIGNFHTDSLNETPCLMDEGGVFDTMFGFASSTMTLDRGLLALRYQATMEIRS